MKRVILRFIISAVLLVGSVDFGVADEVCRPCPFSCRVLRISDKDCSDRQGFRGMCCVDLDNRGMDRLRELERPASQGQRPDGGYYGGRNRDWDYHGGRRERGDRDEWDRGDYDRGYDRDSYSGRRRHDPGAYDDRNGFQPGDCPVGYHVNDRECTFDERARGCSDIRSPSNQICVGWNVRRW